MHPRCVQIVEAAAKKLGKPVTQEYLRKMDDIALQERRKLGFEKPDMLQTMTEAEINAEVGNRVAEFVRADAARKIRNEQDSILKLATLDAKVTQASAKGMMAFKAMQHEVGFIPDGKGGSISVETAAKARLATYLVSLKKFFDYDKDNTRFLMFASEEGQLKLIRELFGVDTGDAKAKEAAQSIRESYDTVHKDFKSKGGDIAYLENYFPQKQDYAKVYGSGFSFKSIEQRRNEYVERRINRVDSFDENGRPVDDAKKRSMLEEQFNAIITDGYTKRGDRNAHGSSIANRHREMRVFKYRSPEAYFADMKDYGAGSILEQTLSYMQGMSNEITMMDKFGPNPLHTIDVLKQKARDLDKDKYTDKIVKEENRLDAMVESMLGMRQGIENHRIHSIFRTFKDINVANSLGSILTSQLADNGTAIMTTNLINAKISEWGLYKMQFYGSSEAKAFARSSGVAMDALTDGLVRFADQTSSNTLTGKLASATMVLSGSHAFTNNHRNAFGMFALSHVSDMAQRFTWDTLDAGSKALLESSGFTKETFDIIKLAKPEKVLGRDTVGLQEMSRISNDDIRPIVQSQIDALYKSYQDKIDALSVKNAEEAQWIAKRDAKLQQYKSKIQKMIDQYEATREKRVTGEFDSLKSQLDVLSLQLEKAELGFELAKHSGDIESTIKLSETIGKRQAELNINIRNKLKEANAAKKAAGKEVFAKATEFEKRIDSMTKEFDDFVAKSNERVAKRNDAIQRISDSIGKETNKLVERAKEDAIMKLTGFAIQFSDLAVLRPGVFSQTLIQLQRGSIGGELAGALLQFKNFPIAFIQMHYQQAAQMSKNPWIYRANLLAVTSAIGGIANWMTDLASGRDPREMYKENDPAVTAKFAWEAMMKGGGLSILGDVLNVNFEGRDPVERLSGPTIGKLVTAGKLGQELWQFGKKTGQELTQGYSTEKDTQLAKRFLDAGKQYIPFNNLIWTRAAWNNLVMAEMNEIVSPGYKGRIGGLANKNYGSDYWLGMDRPIEETRLPNLMNAVGQDQQ